MGHIQLCYYARNPVFSMDVLPKMGAGIAIALRLGANVRVPGRALQSLSRRTSMQWLRSPAKPWRKTERNQWRPSPMPAAIKSAR